MKFKAKFARIVNEAQLVEVLIDADSLDEANEKFLNEDFQRFLVVKRELKQVTPVGKPEFEEIG